MEGRPLDDAELAERARRGDIDAYEALIATYQQVAFRVAYLITRDEGEAQDAVQDAFVRAYYALDRFRSGASFKPWLLRIVSNQARNRRRSAGRRLDLATRVGANRPSGDAAPSPEGTVLADEDKDRLLAAVNKLKEEDRLIISYRYFLELSEAETAALMRRPKGTVKSRLSRALARLREQLEPAADFAEAEDE